MLNITRQEFMEIEEPLRYIGGEYDSIIKPEYDIKIRVALCYPNLYDIGIKNYTMTFLYSAINNIKNVSCERCFLPYKDFEKLLKNKDINLYSLETKTSLNKFDFVVFVISDVMEYINIIAMLKMSKIDYSSSSRNRPILIAMFEEKTESYYAISDIFDLLVFSDMKAIYNDIIFRYNMYNLQKLPKEDFLQSVNSIENVIVPSIDNNKEIKVNERNKIKNIFKSLPIKIPVSSMASVKQSLAIKFLDVDSTLNYTLNMIKRTGLKDIEIVCENLNYQELYEYLCKLQIRYKFLSVKVRELSFDETTKDIYILTKMINSKIYFKIPEFCEKDKKNIFNRLKSNIKLAFENDVSNICLIKEIGNSSGNYHDLEEVVKFINDIKQIYFDTYSSKRKSNLNVELKLINSLELDIQKMELKYKFLEEKLYDVKLLYETPTIFIFKKILNKKDTSLINLLIKAEENGVRIYKNFDRQNIKILNKTLEELKLDVNKYLK